MGKVDNAVVFCITIVIIVLVSLVYRSCQSNLRMEVYKACVSNADDVSKCKYEEDE